MAHPVEHALVVHIGFDLWITTGQLMNDMPELLDIRAEVGALADKLLVTAPGAKEVTLTWSVDRAPEEEHE